MAALVASLTFQVMAIADYSDSSSDSGNFGDASTGNMFGPFSSTIVVPVSEIITDVEVTVNVQHSWVGDVTATLTHTESGIAIDLIPTAAGPDIGESDNLGDDPGNNDNLIPAAYTFTDAGTETIRAHASGDINRDSNYEIPAGNYRVADGTLANGMANTFGGVNTMGSWTILFSDNSFEDDGFIDGWSISFTSAIPEPSSFLVLGLACSFALIRRNRLH